MGMEIRTRYCLTKCGHGYIIHPYGRWEALHCLGVMVGDRHVRQILGKINALPHQQLYHTLNMDVACTVGGVIITGLAKRSPNC